MEIVPQLLNMAKITWGFNVSAKGSTKNFEVKSAYTDGFVFGPKELPVSIRPRSEKHSQVIEENSLLNGVFLPNMKTDLDGRTGE